MPVPTTTRTARPVSAAADAFGRVREVPVAEPALAVVGTAVNAGIGSGIAVADAAL